MSSWDVAADPTAALRLPATEARVALGFDSKERVRLRRYLRVKRGMDVFGAVLGLLIFSPAMVASGILLFLISPGPIVFRHKRLGQHGREFRCYKLRTMVRNAEEILTRWLSDGSGMKAEFEKGFKLKRDPRIIPMIGRILRKSSLDEVPQFINILKGEMSLIGPRPIVRAERRRYGDAYRIVSHVKPGLTGLWQVSGRNRLDYAERVRLDLLYVRELDFWGHVRILARTFRAIFELGGL